MLTLTATPIPRTLNMALGGLARPLDHRDAACRPARRQDVRRRVERPTIREAVLRELAPRRADLLRAQPRREHRGDGRSSSQARAGSRRARRPRPDVRARARERDARLLSPAVQRAALHDDHRERHRHADRQHDHHRPRRPLRPRAAAPAARPGRPLAPPGVRVSGGAAAARCRPTRRSGSRRSSRSRISARASCSRRTTSRSAARASCSARGRAARSRRSASRSTTSCSGRAVAALREGREPDLEDPFAHESGVEIGFPALIPEDYMPDVHMRLVHYKRIANAARRPGARRAAGGAHRPLRPARRRR